MFRSIQSNSSLKTKTKNAMFENPGISLYLQPVSHRLYLSHLFLPILLQLPLMHLRRFPRQSFRSLYFSLSSSKMQLLTFGRHGYASALCNTWRCNSGRGYCRSVDLNLRKMCLDQENVTWVNSTLEPGGPSGRSLSCLFL